jgi:hypothetical protein
MRFAIVVPWHNKDQKDAFLKAWGVRWIHMPKWLFLQEDRDHEGCARTKNKGIRAALDAGAEVICVLDDDCLPSEQKDLEAHAEAHIAALQEQEVTRIAQITQPASRGTPYLNKTILMPVAASMGFWNGVPDLDAATQLRHDGSELKFAIGPVYGMYFPMSGMNLAFRSEWWPWCQFINVPRWDDVFMGWLLQRKAYSDGYCFNLNGPRVHHVRQSNVWKNLVIEAENMERNDLLWKQIASEPILPYDQMLARHNLTI